jgi:glycosyltransferase involved in cell wall biosynthesis
MSAAHEVSLPAPKEPTLTVLMTVYNSAPYLEESIRSILQQSFRDFEFIIIDDASTDESPGILARFAQEDSRIRIVSNDENIGAGESSNKGFALARAPLIARLDSDDIAERNRLELQVAYMNEHPEVGVLGSSLTVIDEQGNVLGDRWGMPLSHAMIVWGMLFWTTMPHPAVIYRKSVMHTVGYATDAEHRANDLKLWIDLAERGVRFANLPAGLVRYRIRAGQMSDVFKSESQRSAEVLRRSYARFLLGEEFADHDLECLLTAQRRAGQKIGLVQLLRVFSIGKACARSMEKKGVVRPCELEALWQARRGTMWTIARQQLGTRLRWAFGRG